MIKKLRRKFVIINMSLVAVILCVVLGMFCFTRIHAFRAESEIAMRQMLDSSRSKEPPKNDTKPQSPSLDFGPGGRNPAFNSTPVFLVTLDENNEITDTNSSGSYTVTDTLSEAAVSAAFAVSEDQGYLSDLKLRFIKQNTPEGTKIAFADTVQETRALGELVIQCVMMLLLFLLCFLLVSIFLARWALKPVEKAWEQQNQFIADASHELKTPLTVILANLRILLSHKDATIRDELQWVESTQAEGERMQGLVADLLLLARLDAEETDIVKSKPKERIDLSNLVEGELLQFESVAFERAIELESNVDEGIAVLGSIERLRRLVTTLLDNACKYADDNGKARVELHAQNGNACLVVHNTGSLIPAEDLRHVFDRFYRADKARTSGTGGFGLGLSIAKEVAEEHGGTITAKSSDEEGTTFTATLPTA